jgi:hypothetical protein
LLLKAQKKAQKKKVVYNQDLKVVTENLAVIKVVKNNLVILPLVTGKLPVTLVVMDKLLVTLVVNLAVNKFKSVI